jgi:hypothetical protein
MDRKVRKEKIMIAKTPKSRYADHIKEWEDMTASLVPSASEAPQIEFQRAALQKMLEDARDLTTQQALFQAQKQEVSKKLGSLIIEGRRLATVLRATVKQHYGIKNEKLVQFGLQPFRGRPQKVEAQPTPAPGGSPQPQPHPSPSPSSATNSSPASHSAE